MATLDSSDANILDAESTNWRAIVYPILAIVIILTGGFFYYYYSLSQRTAIEAKATDALLKAKTPEELAQVAANFPNTDNGTLALIDAGNMSFDKKNYDASIGYYKQAMNGSNDTLVQSARMGLASAQEGDAKLDDAINTYLIGAHLGKSSPYAPYAYISAARLYAEKGDKEDQLKTLSDLISGGFDAQSSFMQDAKNQMSALTAPAPAPAAVQAPPAAPAPVVAPAPVAPAAPVKK